ncbi:aspartate-semialdehyde dehydrogenase [Falsiroseomonas oryziterrae]|uniref:aspartate-semialdehyde dehydrogenase n=1 Tax=Falsiroseomonas oryziterrae TaxID=2911368 RepID=UPI001F010341|nr:aspartate-semialdehyde dehydrogenase [Roseomonas sp. NPKOSM-4]
MGMKVAVVGATGQVGREILRTLAERDFPASEVVALAPGRGGGAEVSYGEERVLRVRGLDGHDFRDTDLVFFAAGEAASATEAPRAAAAGAMVVDLSARFRMEPDVPLVVPEANAATVARARKRRIVACPGSVSTLVAVALKPLHALGKARRAVVTGFQAVAGAGKEAMDELWAQTRGVYVNETPPPEQFPKQIAFNLIPQVGDIGDDGVTRDEAGIALELRKLIDPDLVAVASCLRVPVFIGDAASVVVEFERPVAEKDAWAALREAPGVIVMDRREEAGYATPAEVAGEDAVYVSRLRRDTTVPHGLAFWCATDTLRKGGALNAVQVAEELVRLKLVE